MEITVRREDLVRDLQVIQGIVDRRGAIAILSNALLVASDDALSLSATDLDVSVKAVCPARVKKPGSTTLPARKLHDIIKALPSGSDILLRDDEEGLVLVQSERTNYKIAALPKDDFPSLPESKGAAEVALPAAVMSRLIGKTSFAITVEDARYYLGGALLLVQGDTVSMVTTDGHRLCFAREKVDGAKFKDERVLIPRKAIQELKQVTDGEDTVFFSRTENHLIFRTPRRTLTSKIVEGQFPAHEKVIAAKGPKVGQTKRIELLDALRRVSLLSTERSRAIRLTMKPGEIELHASSPDQGEAVETFAAEYAGDQVDIGFNAQYLMDFLSVLTDSDITIELKDSDAQGIFYPTAQKDGDSMHRYVLMPMRL
ncbi:MAG: DNA polymerase III subunit beta [Vicinamibacteria bacterium]|nr:DNA polymerase III subunit beta [Vicinamibacteria bacterium]